MKYIDFYHNLKNNYPVFSRADIEKIAIGKVLDVQLSDWVKKGLLVKPRRDVYLLRENINLNPFLLSNRLFRPSYVSLESALFYWGLIPDIVSTVTAVTSKRTRKFEFNNQLFSYQKIKSNLFFGYGEIRDKEWGFLMASPEKSILDYFYLNLPKLRDKNDWYELRIDAKIYSKVVNRTKLFKLLRVFNSVRMNIVIKEFDKYIRSQKT